MRGAIMLALAVLALTCRVAQAQHAGPAWPRLVIPISPDRALSHWRSDARLLVAHRGAATHARTGGIIGGIVMGAAGAILGAGLCHFDDPCPHPAPYVVGGLVLGAVAGAAIGAHIGRQYPRVDE